MARIAPSLFCFGGGYLESCALGVGSPNVYFYLQSLFPSYSQCVRFGSLFCVLVLEEVLMVFSGGLVPSQHLIFRYCHLQAVYFSGSSCQNQTFALDRFSCIQIKNANMSFHTLLYTKHLASCGTAKMVLSGPLALLFFDCFD